MIKASKIWKIEKVEHPYFSGQYFSSYLYLPKTLTQLVYNTELDCLLDIVTEPQYSGMKVYKHQCIEITETDEDSLVEFALIKPVKARWLNESCYDDRESIMKRSSDSFVYVHDEPNRWIQSKTKTIYHWVEAFMQ